MDTIYIIEGSYLTSLVSAIKNKVGIFEPITLNNAINAYDSLNPVECDSELVDRTITEYNKPHLTLLRNYAFAYCENLSFVNFPNIKRVTEGSFQNCISLTSVEFKSAEYIDLRAFYNCVNLTTAKFPKVSSIAATVAFYGCLKLSSLYLTNSSVCLLSHSNAFSNTAIANKTGYIYVPSSLVASYKTATNWTYYSNQIVGI